MSVDTSTRSARVDCANVDAKKFRSFYSKSSQFLGLMSLSSEWRNMYWDQIAFFSSERLALVCFLLVLLFGKSSMIPALCRLQILFRMVFN